MGIGELYALICALLWASAIVLFRHAGESMTANSLNLIKNTIGVSLLVPTAMLLEGFVLPQLSAAKWGILIASGYFGIAVADSWYLQALRHLGAGRTAIVASLYSPFVIILSLIFLGERLATWKWIGFTMVVVGILVLVYQKHYQHLDRQQLIKGIPLAAGSVLLTAAGIVAMKPILGADGFFWLVTLRLLAGTLGLVVYLALRQQLLTTLAAMRSEQHKWRTIIIASVLGTYLAMIFWLAGFKYANASVASVLNETSGVFIVLMAWLFLKEGLSVRKLAGVVITFAGVAIFIAV